MEVKGAKIEKENQSGAKVQDFSMRNNNPDLAHLT
jgi:hypothetical protein